MAIHILILFGLFFSGSDARFTEWNKVGVLSTGNFHTVHHLVKDATPVVTTGTDDMYAKVVSGELDAGLISGVPDKTRFDVHPSGSISPRGMFTRSNDTAVRQLMDAAIVRVINSGKLFDIAESNQPFNFVEVHTCRSAEPDTHFPFQAGTPRVIKVGALGPYDWKQDGDYTASPPTGYWPEVFNEINRALPSGYSLERVWFPSSVGVMNALQNGTVDVTEPYWTIDSFYNNRPRTWSFDHGCTVLGYESNFFTLKAPVKEPEGTPQWVIIVSSVVGAVAFLCLVAIGVMIRRERKGNPIFSQALLPQGRRVSPASEA